MNRLNLTGRAALATAVSAFLGLGQLSAQTSLDFVAFETSGVSDLGDLEFIDLEALIVSASGGVSIGIHNHSAIGDPGITATQPTVTKIFFDDRDGVLGEPVDITGSGPDVIFARNDSAKLPGGRAIEFDVDKAFSATPPPSMTGLDPGDSVVFLFGDTVYEDLVSSIISGRFRIALHVQEVGAMGEDSAAFVSVPEPASAALGLLGMLLLLRRRRS